MGKELISASGKGHSAINLNWVLTVVFGVIIVAGIFLAPGYFNAQLEAQIKKKDANIAAERSAQRSNNDPAFLRSFRANLDKVADERNKAVQAKAQEDIDEIVKVFTVFLIVMLVLDLIWGFVFHAKVSKNAIHVYEDCIKGLSINVWAQLTDFHLTYDQVSSVEVISGGKKLVINAANSKYKFYAMNAGEVRDAIVEQKKQAKGEG